MVDWNPPRKKKGNSSSTSKLTCRKLPPHPFPPSPAYFRKKLTSVCFNRLNSGSKPTQRRSKVKTHILPFLFPRCFWVLFSLFFFYSKKETFFWLFPPPSSTDRPPPSSPCSSSPPQRACPGKHTDVRAIRLASTKQWSEQMHVIFMNWIYLIWFTIWFMWDSLSL